ncbi:MAG: hypothetical protein ACJ76F_01490 [Bacteroidia bacterium]
MKSINFQRNKSLIRIVNEQKIKKRRNWDRLIYIILLILFLVFLLYYLAAKFIYVHAFGHVIIESTHIRLTDDSRIVDLKVSEGDSVCTGDTLFAYALDVDADINSGSGSGYSSLSIGSLNGSGGQDLWWLKEIYNLRKKISMNNIDITENNQLIFSYQKEIKRISNEVILDVLPKNRLEYIQNEIMRLNSEILKLKNENTELYGLIGTLGPLKPKSGYTASNVKLKSGGTNKAGYNYGINPKLSFSDELLTEDKYFRAPIDGVITRIFIHQYETALKSEDILTIHKDHPAFIKAYFEQEDLRYFKVGDEFDIEFPDGTVSRGVLKRFYIATYVLPEEFQKKYEPTTRSIAADIYPVKSDEMIKWRTFYKMSVDISKTKFD